jgi:hypothetical protein
MKKWLYVLIGTSLLLAACAPAVAPIPTPTSGPTSTETSHLTSTALPTVEPRVTSGPTATKAPVISKKLHATKPESVQLAAGKPQLVEFFAFW